MAVMQKTRGLYVGRVERYVDDLLYGEHNLLSKLIVREEQIHNVKIYSVPDESTRPKNPRELSIDAFTPYNLHTAFGPTWTTHWFTFTCQTAGYLEWKAGCEGLVYDADGTMIAAVSDMRTTCLLPRPGRYFIVLFLFIFLKFNQQ